jgi:hypothetical protein
MNTTLFNLKPFSLHRLRAGLLCLLFLIPIAQSVDAAPAIEVSTSCEAKGMQVVYGAYLYNILDQLRFKIVQHLQDRPQLKYWSFLAGSPLDGGALRIAGSRLQFQILEPQRNQLQIRMTYSTPHSEPPPWSTTWMEPGQLVVNGYPTTEKAAEELFEVVQQKLLGPYEAPLRSFFVESAPLATGGQWDESSKDPRLVLPLPWDRYSLLRRSQFRLECSRSAQTDDAEGELISRAISPPSEFQETHQHKYRAITVAPETWRLFEQEHPQSVKKFKKIRQLYAKRAYLYKEEFSGLSLELFKEDTP